MPKLTYRSFGEEEPKYALIINKHYDDQQTLEHYYLNSVGESCLIYSVEYDKKKAVSANYGKSTLRSIIEDCIIQGIEYIFCCDAKFFPYLAKGTMTKAIGLVVPCVLDDAVQVIACPNHASTEYDPSNKNKIEVSLNTLKTALGQSSFNTQFDITLVEESEVPQWLKKLHNKPMLAVDIEAYSLKHYDANTASIAFAWSSTEAISFFAETKYIRGLLAEFFACYGGTLLFYNASYDVKVLTYDLYMRHLEDFTGMVQGLNLFKKRTIDVMALAKIATNSTTPEDLSLKSQTIEYMGNYAEDVSDITKLEPTTLLEYNAKDSIATFWLYQNKYNNKLMKPNLWNFYTSILHGSIFVCMRMSLTGMPIVPTKVNSLSKRLRMALKKYKHRLSNLSSVKEAEHKIQLQAWNAKKSKLKTKIPTMDEVYEPFNPNSYNHLSCLLFDILSLKTSITTDTGMPSTGKYAMAELRDKYPEHKDLFDLLKSISDIEIILSTFIPAFKKYSRRTNSGYRLYGEFNALGTQSFRLSSNSPNMQNLPSGSTYGKAVKELFVAMAGKALGGADYEALEAKIGALLTQDPNKIKEYAEGYDSHSLMAYTYWPEQMPDIEDNVHSINSIKVKYDKIRSKSKTATFALQYLCQPFTLTRNLRFSPEDAQQIYDNYWALYAETRKYLEMLVQHASEHGFVPLAFGAELKTPLLHGKLNLNIDDFSPNEAAELRSAYNAASQSYGLLLARALIDFSERLDSSTDPDIQSIELCNQIHDSIYLQFARNRKTVNWVNFNLIDAMSWQDDIRIQSEEITLSAELDVGLSWSTLKPYKEISYGKKQPEYS